MSLNTKGLIVEIDTEHRPADRGHELLETRSPLVKDVLLSRDIQRIARRACHTYGINQVRISRIEPDPAPFAWFTN